MAFQYDPKEAGNKLVPDGEYEAVVSEAEETTSKKGSAMIKLMVKIWARGETFHIPDYIVSPSGLWKLRQLVTAIGMPDAFDKGSIEAKSLIGKNCLAFVRTRKDETGKYQDQNVISKYSPSAEAGDAIPPSESDDELAF